MERLFRIEADHFVAGIVYDGYCRRAAPILKYMIGKEIDWIESYAKKKGWGFMEVLPEEKSERSFETFTSIDQVAPTFEEYDPKYLIGGDTDSVFINLSEFFEPGEDQNLVCEFADTIGELVNKEFPTFMQTVFNAPIERSKIIETDREVVSDKSLFITQKKYVIHMVNKEGVPVDKWKMMGVEIIKSDTPKYVQNILRTIAERLCDGATEEEINEYVELCRIDYVKQSIKEIGVPKTVKTFNKYIDLYDQRVREGAEDPMKSFPYQVRAAMFYNNLCESRHSKIRQGEKTVLVYLDQDVAEQVLGDRIKYISVPTDAEDLPPIINQLKIDWDVMWSKVKKKIDIYLAPVDDVVDEPE